MTTVEKAPADYSNHEIDQFVELVSSGGEVTPAGFRNRVMAAEALVFCTADDTGGEVFAVGAVKNPLATYRRKVSRRAEFELPEAEYPFELGWVVVRESQRGNGLSHEVVRRCIEAAGASGVFATSAVDNRPMHRTLERAEFVTAGRPYSSARAARELQLFIRRAP